MISLDVRFGVLARANGRCEGCGNLPPGEGRRGLHLHHIEYRRTDTPENLVALCPKCHRGRHPKPELGPALLREMIPMRLTRDEKAWLQAVASSHGVSMADAARMLIHAEAERRGLKEKIAA